MNEKASTMLSALVFCIASTLAPASIARQGASPTYDDERAAREMLDRAEELARRGQYAQAHRAYPKIVAEHPGTAAAKVAERRSKPSAFLGWTDIVRRGDSKNRVDVVIMDEGYELEHQKAFDDLAADTPAVVLRVEPFKEYASYFNFLRANLVSADDGVDGFGREYDTALDAHMIATISGHVAVDARRVRDMLAEMPEHDDLAIVFVKQGVLGTAGAGYATVGGMNARTTVHEFGHAFARLSDEYATANFEPRNDRGLLGMVGRINVSTTEDRKLVPWAHWLEAKHPSVGVYEGALGHVRDAWRPVASGCVMNDGEFFCPVCREALVLRIYSLVDPIESCEPPAQGFGRENVISIAIDHPLEIEVKVMQPATHDLDVRWWILPEVRFPISGEGRDGNRVDVARAYRDRRERGPLAAIADRPSVSQPSSSNGVHRLRLSRTELDKGTYRVICRVRDTTKLRDEKWPWVLKDDRDLLESERAWWVIVQ